MSMMGERVRLYIQRGNGELQEISGHVTNMNTFYRSMDIPMAIGDKPGANAVWDGTVETTLTIVGNHNLSYSADDLSLKATKMKTAAEWRCDHCTTVNLREHRGCTACGFPRSFLYG